MSHDEINRFSWLKEKSKQKSELVPYILYPISEIVKSFLMKIITAWNNILQNTDKSHEQIDVILKLSFLL